MSDRLREALERLPEANVADELKLWSQRGRGLRLVAAAARRFLALTETGPDYEAAYREYAYVVNCQGFERRGWCDGCKSDSRKIVDAALADYLTEEET